MAPKRTSLEIFPPPRPGVAPETGRSAPRVEAPPVPVKPKGSESGLDAVRSRAGEAFGELSRCGEKVKERAGYILKLRSGTATPEEVERNRSERIKGGRRMHGRLESNLIVRARAGKKELKVFQAAARIEITSYEKIIFVEEYFHLTGTLLSIDDPNLVEKKKAFLGDSGRLRGCKTKKERFVVIRQLLEAQKGTVKVKASIDEVDKTLVTFAAHEDKIGVYSAVIASDKASAAFVQKAAVTDNPEQAFAAAAEADPEVKALYEQYQRTWYQEQFSDVFPPETSAVPGATPPEPQQVFNAQRVIEAAGVRFDLAGGSNTGEIRFGSMVREAAVLNVNGEPKLFIYDKNADRGVRGPLELSNVRPELLYSMVDEYFSDKFREFATAESEKDPTKVADSRLLKICHALLPEIADNTGNSLDGRQRRIIANLARLFAAPDKESVSMDDKTRAFVEKMAAHPEQAAFAKDMLARRGFADRGVTISGFLAGLPS